MEGSALLYQCNQGFGPVGEKTAVCAANGSWSPDPVDVTCREIGMIIPAIHQVVLNSQYKSAEVASINEMACWHSLFLKYQ